MKSIGYAVDGYAKRESDLYIEGPLLPWKVLEGDGGWTRPIQTRMPDLPGAGLQKYEEVRKRFHRASEGSCTVHSSGRDREI